MGLAFTVYENISHNDVEIKKVHEIEEVVHFSNVVAMIITNWFYRKDGDSLRGTFDESNHYVECTGEDLYEIVKALDNVLSSEDRDLMALHYFPVLYVISYSNVEMWSDKYYSALLELYDGLKNIVPSDSVSNRERLFYYNVCW